MGTFIIKQSIMSRAMDIPYQNGVISTSVVRSELLVLKLSDLDKTKQQAMIQAVETRMIEFNI